MSAAPTAYDVRQDMRVDLLRDVDIDIMARPDNGLGYHALDYMNIGAPMDVEEESDAAVVVVEDKVGTPTKSSLRDVISKHENDVTDYETHLNHCGYDEKEGDNFIDDSELVEAALQVRDAGRLKTVMTGFHVNRGKIATIDEQQDSPRASFTRFHKGGSLSSVEVDDLFEKISQKAATLFRKLKLQTDKPSKLKKIPKALDSMLVSARAPREASCCGLVS